MFSSFDFTIRIPLTISLFISVLVVASFPIDEASAGGFDPSFYELEPSSVESLQPLPASTIDSSSMREQKSQNTVEVRSISLDERTWSASYREGESLCRESVGDVICLSLPLAENIGW